MKNYGTKMALRHVLKREANDVIVDTAANVMDITGNKRYNIILHQEGHLYAMDIDINGFAKPHRTHRFSAVS